MLCLSAFISIPPGTLILSALETNWPGYYFDGIPSENAKDLQVELENIPDSSSGKLLPLIKADTARLEGPESDSV